MRHLTAIIFDKRVNSAWSSEYLPLVQRIMKAKVHDTIGVSPAELLFGKAINLYTVWSAGAVGESEVLDYRSGNVG